ncbi:MAG: hypothetical protein AAF512_16060 [Pseudomonadota bacterium]
MSTGCSSRKVGPFPAASWQVDGYAAPGFETTKSAVEKNYAEGMGLNSQLYIIHRGEVIIDLCGSNLSDPRAAQDYHHDTVQVVFSSGKSFTALTLNMAIDRHRWYVESDSYGWSGHGGSLAYFNSRYNFGIGWAITGMGLSSQFYDKRAFRWQMTLMDIIREQMDT